MGFLRLGLYNNKRASCKIMSIGVFCELFIRRMGAKLLKLQSADGFGMQVFLILSSYPNPMSATCVFCVWICLGVNKDI